MLGGIGCFFSSAITLLVCLYTRRLSIFSDASNHQIFFPRSTTNEIGYQVKPQSPIPNSRSASHYAFSPPTSPKSPVNFVQYHQRHRREYPPIEVDCGFPHIISRSRTRMDRNFRSLDFELGIRADNASSYSEAPSYHQYPEEDQWEGWGRGRRREGEYPKTNVEAAAGTTDEDAPQPAMAILEARARREEVFNPPLQPTMNLHPYVRAPVSTRRSFQTNFHDFRSPLSLLPSVRHQQSNERDKP